MNKKDHAVPGAVTEVSETTLGVSQAREAAGAVGDFELGGTLPVTRVDLTTTETVTTDSPGV